MPELVADCPRCGAKSHTFDVFSLNIYTPYTYEVFSVCKNCNCGTIFLTVLSNDSGIAPERFSQESIFTYKKSLNNILRIIDYINTRNLTAKSPPDFIPDKIQKIFLEGSQSFSGNCPNASAAMFRLCVDLATKDLLPDEGNGLNQNVKKRLYDRLNWLMENNILSKDLHELSDCIREDGNDGVHDGTVTQIEAEDLLDFTYILLERIYTEPERTRLAKKRKDERRA